VNERIINLPPQISPPLNQALFDDIEWALQQAEPKSERAKFKFGRFLIVARAGVATDGKKGKKAKKSEAQDNGNSSNHRDQFAFTKVEDSIFYEFASLAYSFNSSRSAASSEESKRVVMVVAAEDVPKVLAQLQALDLS
jgi:protein BCP1